MCVLFHTEKHVWPIKIFPDGISMFFRRQIWVSKKKFKFLKLFSSRKPEIWLELRCNSGNNKLQSYKVNTFTLYSLWVRFFLPIGHIDQGMTRGIGSSKCCPQQAAVGSQGSRRKQCGRSLETGSFRRYYSCLPEGWKQHPTVVPSSRHICRFFWRVRQCVVREWQLTPTGIKLDSGNRQGWWKRLIFMQGS